MENTKEMYYIQNEETQKYYDTDDEKWYPDNWVPTLDTKEYLEMLMDNNPEKFEGCTIEYIEV